MHLFERNRNWKDRSSACRGPAPGSGKVVLRRGEAGIGKSSLVELSFSGTGASAHALGYMRCVATPRALGPV